MDRIVLCTCKKTSIVKQLSSSLSLVCSSQKPICLFVMHPNQQKKTCKLHSIANGFINFHLVLPCHFIWFERKTKVIFSTINKHYKNWQNHECSFFIPDLIFLFYIYYTWGFCPAKNGKTEDINKKLRLWNVCNKD